MTAATAMGYSFTSDAVLDVYTSGLKNAHALEQQATQLIERQLERYERYPEVSQGSSSISAKPSSRSPGWTN